MRLQPNLLMGGVWDLQPVLSYPGEFSDVHRPTEEAEPEHLRS